jgi:hypothetical protein
MQRCALARALGYGYTWGDEGDKQRAFLNFLQTLVFLVFSKLSFSFFTLRTEPNAFYKFTPNLLFLLLAPFHFTISTTIFPPSTTCDFVTSRGSSLLLLFPEILRYIVFGNKVEHIQ